MHKELLKFNDKETTQLKIGKDLSKHFTKEDIQVNNKHKMFNNLCHCRIENEKNNEIPLHSY